MEYIFKYGNMLRTNDLTIRIFKVSSCCRKKRNLSVVLLDTKSFIIGITLPNLWQVKVLTGRLHNQKTVFCVIVLVSNFRKSWGYAILQVNIHIQHSFLFCRLVKIDKSFSNLSHFSSSFHQWVQLKRTRLKRITNILILKYKIESPNASYEK